MNRLIPWWADVLLVALVAGGMSLAVYGYGRHQREAGRQEVQAKWNADKLVQQKAVIQSQARTIAINQAEDAKAIKVDTHANEQNQSVDLDVARAVAERDRLRDTLARVRADAMSEATTRARLSAELAAASDSLSECSRSYSALADQSDRLSIQVSGLLDLMMPE